LRKILGNSYLVQAQTCRAQTTTTDETRSAIAMRLKRNGWSSATWERSGVEVREARPIASFLTSTDVLPQSSARDRSLSDEAAAPSRAAIGQ
jgi:hypothetical protein